MYRKYYGLKADPFRLSPDHAFCLPHRSFAKAKAYMRYAMHRGEGFVMITGAPGTGKTTLIDDLLAGIQDVDFSIGRLVSAQVDADDILRMVASEFGITAQQTDKSEILRLLSNKFTIDFKRGTRSLLIVDEAQGLGLSALEELRLLTNLRVGGQPMLQIFLVGQEELRDMVTSPELEQLNQRMIAAYHMEPLKPDEFVAYVLHRLTVAGWKGNPRFKPELFPELFRFSNGLPRRINHICSRLLLHGFLEEKGQLDAADIDVVIKELRAEHYSIRESSALITQEEFNAEDLQWMARSAMSQQAAAADVSVESVHPLTVVENNGVQQAAIVNTSPKLVQKMAASSVVKQECSYSESPDKSSEFPAVNWKSRVGKGRFSHRLPVMRVTTWAAISLISIGLFLLLLISVPIQQLNKVASQSLWNNVGLTKIRAQVSSWSGGRLPLKGVSGYEFQPVSPTVIERIEAEPKQTLGKFKTATESKQGSPSAQQLNKEILGDEAPVLSESGTKLFK